MWGGGGGGGRITVSHNFFFSFCRNLSLNHVNFNFPAMFFFSSSIKF